MPPRSNWKRAGWIGLASLLAGFITAAARDGSAVYLLLRGLRDLAMPALLAASWYALVLTVALTAPRLVYRLLQGLRCPGCRSRDIRCLSVTPFGYRYFLCGACAERWKRTAWGRWQDASSTEDASHFVSRIKRRGHQGPIRPIDYDLAEVDADDFGSRTAAARLLHARKTGAGTYANLPRRPNAPDAEASNTPGPGGAAEPEAPRAEPAGGRGADVLEVLEREGHLHASDEHDQDERASASPD